MVVEQKFPLSEEYVGSFAPIVLSMAAGRDELFVSECCCFVSPPTCPSPLSQQTHNHQPGHLLLCAPQLCPTRVGHSGSWSFPPVDTGN